MEEDFEKHKLDIDQHLDEEEEEEENPEEKIKTHWNPLIIKSAMKGDIDTIKKCLDKKANLFYEEKKWNALVWACSKGHTDLVRFLLEKSAGNPYLPKDEKAPEVNTLYRSVVNQEQTADKNEKKAGQGVINNSARPTPLQWACFKGHVDIVYLLLKEGLDLFEADSFGNNAIHQAVAGGNLTVVQVLLQYGVRIDSKNNRGHTVFDLCTEPQILQLLKQYTESANCAETNKPFAVNDVKYLCIITGKYFSEEASELHCIYASNDSATPEKLERRSNKAQQEIMKVQDELEKLIKLYEYEKLCEVIRHISASKIHVDVKLLHKAVVHEKKLETQIMINKFIDSLREVDDYKTIRKSVNTVKDMIDNAREKDIHLDEELIERANKEMERLYAERELRFILDNPAVARSTPEEVERVEELKKIALDKGVATKYCEEQEELLDKMRKNIEANVTITNFCEYPQRDWYPPPYYIDAKTKKAMDPATKKPIDPALLKPPPVKKKKGKKAPKFTIPDWAMETAELGKCIKRLEELLVQSTDIEVSEDALQKSVEQLERMKKEFKYRKQLDEEAKIEAEKAKKKKK